MKSCNCLWAEDDGTCGLGEDPPIEATCGAWMERKDSVTGEPLGPVHPAPAREKITWRGKTSISCFCCARKRAKRGEGLYPADPEALVFCTNDQEWHKPGDRCGDWKEPKEP